MIIVLLPAFHRVTDRRLPFLERSSSGSGSSTQLSFTELFLSVLVQKPRFKHIQHTAFLLCLPVKNITFELSQGFPKLSCKEYQLLYTGLPRCLKFLSGDHFLKGSHHSSSGRFSALTASHTASLHLHSLLLKLLPGIFSSLVVNPPFFFITDFCLSVFLNII